MGFKPKESTGKRINQHQEAAFSKEQFVEDLFNDDYLLVVGPEVIMDENVEPTGDVNQYILKALNYSLNQKYMDFNQLMNYSGEGIDPIRNLLNSEEDFSYEINDITKELKELLETRLFRIVLTTTFDGYLETLMRNIWGNNLRVVNIEDKKTLDSLRNELADCRNGRIYNQPTLFYIFGKAVKDETRKYVRTDDDAIQIIEKWIQIPKDDPLLKLIKNKKILALGCKYQDWYFRFFWYILKREINRFNEGQVAFMLDDEDPLDRKLREFLKHSKIYRHQNARTFMHETTQMLTSTSPDNPFRQIVLNNRTSGGVFISYCSKDFIIANKLFFILRKHGYSVWIDNHKLYGGDNYNVEIERAMGEAKIVITLLTPKIAEDLINGNVNNYYNKEWRMATQLEDTTIIPLAVNGYSLRADYHTNGYEQIVGGSISGINLMEKEGMGQLLKAVEKKLSGYE